MEPEVEPEPVGLTFEYTDDTQTAWMVSGYTDDLPADVVIPATYKGLPVTKIGYMAFANCPLMQTVTLPESITDIEDYAFGNVYNLKQFKGAYASADGTCLIMGTTLKALAPKWNLDKYSTFYVPDYVTRIDNTACSYNYNLYNVDVPESVTEIGYEAFRYCPYLKYVNIKGNVTDIQPYTFYDCISIQTVKLPDSVKEIGDGAFAKQYSDGTVLSINIPESLETIGNFAFYLSGICDVVLPDGLKSIGNQAFRGCSWMSKITIPSTIEHIGVAILYQTPGLREINGAFSSDDHRCLIFEDEVKAFAPFGITKYEIPEYVTSIGAGSFWSENLTNVTIPSGVTYIGELAFERSLTLVYSKAQVPPVCHTTAFNATTKSNGVLFVPQGFSGDYRSADVWKEFANIMDYQYDGVEAVISDDVTTYRVYNLNGMLIKVTSDVDELKSLPAGLYIINGKKIAVK